MSICTGTVGACPSCGGSPAAVARCRKSIATAIPLNNAAKRARGLPEDPNEPKNPNSLEYAEYLLKQAGVL